MNEFNPQSKSTIGVEFAFKTIEIRGDEIKGLSSEFCLGLVHGTDSINLNCGTES